MDIVHVNEYRIYKNTNKIVYVKRLLVCDGFVDVCYTINKNTNEPYEATMTYNGYIRHLNKHFEPIPKQKKRNHLPKWMRD